jgi:predicted metalloprotease
MRWQRGTSSPDVIDQRGRRVSGPVALGGGGGIVGVIITLIVLLSSGGEGGAGGFGGLQAPAAGPGDAIPASQDPDRDLKDFSSYVFTNTQDFWVKTFADAGQDYGRAKMVLYSGGVSTGCGSASSAVGPFYCPGDQRVYLDLSFYRQMAEQLKAPGDFAWAYVIAHEMGHHVQRQLGTESPRGDNAVSVKVELQADCYAGVWAHTVFKAGDLEDGDIEEAFTAAEAVGDDRLQREATGTINPDSFTHGTSAQRRQWFDAGYESGKPESCDTFG